MKTNITLCLAACSLASNHAFGMLPKQTTSNQTEITIKIEYQELQEVKKMLLKNREMLHINFVQNSLHHKINHYQLKYLLNQNDDKTQEYCAEQYTKYTDQLKDLQKYYYKLTNNSSSTSSSKNNSSSTSSNED
jgi:hypothetical protein